MDSATSGVVVSLGTITNIELETLVKGPIRLRKLLLSGTRSELERTTSTVVGASVELLDEDGLDDNAEREVWDDVEAGV